MRIPTAVDHHCAIGRGIAAVWSCSESELESLASNAELPFTSLIKGSVLPSHSSKMKKITPGAVRSPTLVGEFVC